MTSPSPLLAVQRERARRKWQQSRRAGLALPLSRRLKSMYKAHVYPAAATFLLIPRALTTWLFKFKRTLTTLVRGLAGDDRRINNI
jgi:hypothetical protein